MDKIQTIKDETVSLLQKMIDSFEVNVEEEEGVYNVIIKTENDAPAVIGRHGETIRALQKILDVILYKKLGEAVDTLINVNDFREKQKKRLEELITKLATKTQQIGEKSYVRGLSPYERKMVHEFVMTHYPDLTTYSIGEGRDREVVIELKENSNSKEVE